MALTVPVAEIVEKSSNPLLGKRDSWGRVLLGDIANIQNGFAFKSVQFSKDDGMPLIRIRDVGADSTDTNYVGEFDPAYVVNPGDLLIGMDGDFKSARWRGPVGLLNQRVCRLTLESDTYHPKFLDYVLPGYLQAIHEMTSSVTVKHLSSKSIAEIPLPLPSIQEQAEMVAEFEKQYSRLDEATTNLHRVSANLKRYKAAVLNAAVEGRLVETEAELARRENRTLPTPRPGVFYTYAIRCDNDSIYIGQTDDLARRWDEHLAGHAAYWTKQHNPVQIVHYEEHSSRQEAADREKWLKTGYGRKWLKREIEAGRARQVGYETGEQLLQRILEARRSQWKGKGKYKEPAAPDIADLPELPEGWVWATVESLSMKVTDGVHRKPSYVPEGIPFVTVKNLTAGNGISFDELNYVTPEDHAEFCKRTHPEHGDILISKDGTLGVVRLIETDRAFSVFVSVALVKPVIYDLSRYLVTAFESPVVQRQMVPKGSGLQHIHLEDLRADCIPVPPLAEQSRIVAEVDRKLSLLQESKAQLDTTLHRSERLRIAVLANAFAAQ